MGKDAKKRRRDGALVIAQTSASLTGHGAIAAALKLAGAAARHLRDRRVELMWKDVVDGMDDPVAFTGAVEQALLRDGDAAAEGFVAAAKQRLMPWHQ